jgi:hypothetical protein
VAAEPPAGVQRLLDPLPDCRKVAWRAERQREARVDQVGRRPLGGLEPRDARLEAAAFILTELESAKPVDRLGLPVDG